jgi:methionyl-tRNA formyltransferase
MRSVIAAHHRWYSGMPERLAARTGQEFVLLASNEELTYDKLQDLNPRYVFLVHWSSWIKPEIFSNFESIVFHMTDVPFGRGGTPLQNLLARGIYETKVSALRCEAELDAGPVYLKRPLSLYGSAEEIYMRASSLIEDMIVEILGTQPEPIKQQGEAVCFPRRKPVEGDLKDLQELRRVFDYIRMLDADGYPKAYLETDHLRLEFTRAALRNDNIVADVKITSKHKR